MLSAVSPSTVAGSSLEEMLESLRQREEQPKDIPPALPTRPTSRARLPTARSLPLNFKVGDSANEYLPNNSKEKEEKGRFKVGDSANECLPNNSEEKEEKGRFKVGDFANEYLPNSKEKEEKRRFKVGDSADEYLPNNSKEKEEKGRFEVGDSANEYLPNNYKEKEEKEERGRFKVGDSANEYLPNNYKEKGRFKVGDSANEYLPNNSKEKEAKGRFKVEYLPKEKGRFKVGDSANEYLPNNSKEKEDKGRDRGLRRGDRESASRQVSFGRKKMKIDQPSESPYGKKPGDEIYGEVIAETGSNHGVVSSTLPQSPEERQWRDNISHFLKKLRRLVFSNNVLRYAATRNGDAQELLYNFAVYFLNEIKPVSVTSGITLPKGLSQYVDPGTLEICLHLIVLSLSVVMAGSGRLQTFRLLRFLRS
ncbi:hypothetical protein NE237_033002 [Protea cynaroides]|uniref:Uncharacterized protein n=1 Tax=Protea cynaroides TaxID=273540 RepID=A0A9Q0R3M4_9MAGN|nr:hypothetical protein NE237_033002 [Protea cynaroides]